MVTVGRNMLLFTVCRSQLGAASSQGGASCRSQHDVAARHDQEAMITVGRSMLLHQDMVNPPD